MRGKEPAALSGTMAMIQALSLAVLLLASSSLLQVARCQSDGDAEVADFSEEVSDLGIVSDDAEYPSGDSFTPASGVDTFCFFPKNQKHLVVAGEPVELLVGMKNDGDSIINVIATQATLHLPFNHDLLVQNLTARTFANATIPPSAQATFPYSFVVSKYLRPGDFDLVGTILYEVEKRAYQSTFYNGSIEVVESGGFLSMESVLLVTLGVSLLFALGLWIHGRLQNFSRKSRRTPSRVADPAAGPKDPSLNEWLQGTVFPGSSISKPKAHKTTKAVKGK